MKVPVQTMDQSGHPKPGLTYPHMRAERETEEELRAAEMLQHNHGLCSIERHARLKCGIHRWADKYYDNITQVSKYGNVGLILARLPSLSLL